MKLEKILPWAAVIAGAFVISKLFDFGKKAADAAGAAYSGAVDATADGLYYFFGPTEKFGSMVDHVVTFPDGSRHSVPNSSLGADGRFVNRNLSPQYAGDGKTYRVLIKKTDRSYYAVPA